jgi:hypothetical protein
MRQNIGLPRHPWFTRVNARGAGSNQIRLNLPNSRNRVRNRVRNEKKAGVAQLAGKRIKTDLRAGSRVCAWV